MLQLLDTGKMAKKFGKWRGAVAVASGAGFSLTGVLIAKIGDLVHSVVPNVERPANGDTLSSIAMFIYAFGVLIAMYGAWQIYRDATRGTYQNDAARYDREGW